MFRNFLFLFISLCFFPLNEGKAVPYKCYIGDRLMGTIDGWKNANGKELCNKVPLCKENPDGCSNEQKKRG